MALSRQRAELDGGFVLHDWDTRHNVMHDGPDRVLHLLDEVVATTRQDRADSQEFTGRAPTALVDLLPAV